LRRWAGRIILAIPARPRNRLPGDPTDGSRCASTACRTALWP